MVEIHGDLSRSCRCALHRREVPCSHDSTIIGRKHLLSRLLRIASLETLDVARRVVGRSLNSMTHPNPRYIVDDETKERHAATK